MICSACDITLSLPWASTNDDILVTAGEPGGDTEPEYPASPTDPSPNTNTLVAFGDSLTDGSNAGGKSYSFTKYLSEHINLSVINAGNGGDTTTSAILRLNEVTSRNPRIVLIEFGGNDYLQGGSTQTVISKAESNYIAMIEALKKENRKIFLLKFYTLEWLKKREGSYKATATKTAWDAMYAKIVEQYPDVGLVENIWDGLVNKSDVLADDIHPNAAGHVIMGENIFNSIKPYLLEQGLVKNP
jgi:acyl-CoA thioesterase-1